MTRPFDDTPGIHGNLALDNKEAMDRFNSRMRHFHGVALTVVADANKLVREIWDNCQDPRTPEEIIDGVELSDDLVPACGWPEFKEKLYLLGSQLDYLRRLLDGSIERENDRDEEVQR